MKQNDFKIVLILPQIITGKSMIRKTLPPLSLGYLAAALEESGFNNVMILDTAIEDYDNVKVVSESQGLIRWGLSNEKIVERLKDFSPSLIGISTMFSSQAECAFSLAKDIKSELVDIPIVMGGNHASIFHEDILKKHLYIDYIMVGESEHSFCDFAECLCAQKDVSSVPGLIWRDNNKIMSNPKNDFIIKMDDLPFPAWHLMKMEEYFKLGMFHNPFVKSGRVGSIMTSRGCPEHCYYCAGPMLMGNRFRAMSAERVVEMIGDMVDDYGIKELQILDDNFTLSARRVIDICKGIEKYNLRITFPNAIRADVPINRERRFEMFCAMKKAGCEQFGLGVEHGDQEFLNSVIGKRLNLEEVVATCELAHKADILVHCNFMMGFPFETEKERKKTVEFAKKLEADSFSVSIVTPLPGTKMWDIVEKNDLFTDWFDKDRINLGGVSIKPVDITEEDLLTYIKDFNHEINEIASKRNPKSREKYDLFKGKHAHGDSKYQFSKEIT